MDSKKLHKKECNAEWRQRNREYYNMYMREYMAYRREKQEKDKIERARQWLLMKDSDRI